jgi:transcriptional regulator with XRE-family HTH domain
MSESEAFGPNLRRLRVQRGISLERIATSTKVNTDLWAGLESNDFSRWPKGIYARAYIRAYAMEVGVDPDVTVDQFCRLFPNGDRRAERVVRQQAALVGHDLRWKDDLVGSTKDDKRSVPATDELDLPPVAFTRTGRVIAALADLTAVLGGAVALRTMFQLGWSASLAGSALTYHSLSLVVLGSTPAVWTIDTYLSHRHPNATRAPRARFLRLIRGSDRVKA